MKILVGEDEALIAFALESDLMAAGYTVVGPAASVPEALKAAEEVHPDLALLNVNLQSGNGIALARTLLERYGTPTIFISGNSFEAKAAGDAALGFIPKPFSFQTVRAAIRIAQAIIAGEVPGDIPGEFKLFRNTGPKA